MLQGIASHTAWIAVGIGSIALLCLLRWGIRQKGLHTRQKELSLLQKRNEALNETLRNPRVKTAERTAVNPMEVQWDEKTINDSRIDRTSAMIELVEFSDYSRRKYIFPANQVIRIGSGLENQLVLPRKGVAPMHCEIFATDEGPAIRTVSPSKALLLRGKTSATIDRRGTLLNNGDHIRLGTADIQFRRFKA